MSSHDCSPDVILLFVLIKYAKKSYFVPGVVGIQAEKPRGYPHEKYRLWFSKWGVIKGV